MWHIRKGEFGNPAEGVDLLAAARSSACPHARTAANVTSMAAAETASSTATSTRACTSPLKISMSTWAASWTCNAPIVTGQPIIRSLAVCSRTITPSIPQEQVSCEQCHVDQQHEDERINTHLSAVACQTCHIPALALEDPTKVTWDWSQAGQEGREDDHFTYLKIKGEFTYDKNFAPTYLWFNGNNEYRYLLGDKIDPNGVTYINKPAGSIDDPNAKSSHSNCTSPGNLTTL
jgi:hypothetical protein